MIGYFTFHAFAPCIKCTVNAWACNVTALLSFLIMCLLSPDVWSAFGIWLNTDFTSLSDAGLRNDISRTILKDLSSELVLNAWSRCPLLCWNFFENVNFYVPGFDFCIYKKTAIIYCPAVSVSSLYP